MWWIYYNDKVNIKMFWFYYTFKFHKNIHPLFKQQFFSIIKSGWRFDKTKMF